MRRAGPVDGPRALGAAARLLPALGGPVRNYEQLLDYLQDKDPAIQRVQLDFDGRNIALFHTGNSDA